MANVELPKIDWEQVKGQLKEYEDFANKLTPIVNKAHSAFGGLEDLQKNMQDFKNTIKKAQAALNS